MAPLRTLCRRRASTASPEPRLSCATERFSSRAGHYARARPSYPSAALELLERRCGLTPQALVADVGSGTGILTELLLARGARVIGVEPNAAMRAVAEARLGAQERFRSVEGSAEATTLAPASIDLLVVGQAFHWFDGPAARREALRVLKPGACGALLWNERPEQPGAFLTDYETLLLRHAAEYAQIKARRAEETGMRAFFGGRMELATFPNEQSLDLEGLTARLLSSSYAPEPAHPDYEPLLAGVREVFGRHAQHGRVLFPYSTLVYFGPLQA